MMIGFYDFAHVELEKYCPRYNPEGVEPRGH